jgi:beta-glucosidase
MGEFAPRKGMGEREIADTIVKVLAEATLKEKVAMMSGHGFFEAFREDEKVWGGRPYRAGGGCERLGVPAFYFTDGPRGVARGNSTCFPCTMARGATFDPDLERRVGEVMGIEARAQGCNLSGAVCVNLLRHPGWGRAQETYGEDPHHLGEMGAALAEGIQTHNVAATVKHFAVNSIENARFKVNVQVDKRTMHEVYLPHFKRILDAGCASVMSAYNKLNGEFCGQHRILLTDILRGQWGFDGFVHSDWVLGVRAVYGASAGLDVENPEPQVFGAKLVAAVEVGTVEPEVIDRACTRILSTLYRFAAAEDPLEDYPQTLVAAPAHTALAREVAIKSAVLLKNDAVLPLRAERLGKVAVLGRLADVENTGDHGSSRVRPPYVVTPLAGLRAALGEGVEILTGSEDDLSASRAAAVAADAVVVLVGYTADEEGEFIPGDIDLGQMGVPEEVAAQQEQVAQASRGGDRQALTLPSAQRALIEAATAGGKPVVVVIVAGSAVLPDGWGDQAGAILQTFYSGMEGGDALADLLLGRVSPSGKLPFTVMSRSEDYPFFDPFADEIIYGPYHGYTLADDAGTVPLYPFGHGLSYANFRYRALSVRRAGDALAVTVDVANEGAMDADEVVQVYVGPPGLVPGRPQRLLKAFRRVTVPAGERRSVRLTMPLNSLCWYDPANGWRLESGEHRIMAGGSSAPDALLTAAVTL